MRRLFYVALPLVAACHIIGGYDDFNVVESSATAQGGSTTTAGGEGGSGATGGAGAMGGMGGSGGPGVMCTDPAECPAPMSECLVATCVDNVCGEDNAPAGTPCATGECDGAGECACLTNADCGGGVCVDKTTCVDPYRWAAQTVPVSGSRTTITSVAVEASGNALIGIGHDGDGNLVTDSGSTALTTNRRGFSVASLNDAAMGAPAWVATYRADIFGNRFATPVGVGANAAAFVAGSYVDDVSLDMTSPGGTASLVGFADGFDRGFVGFVNGTATPLLASVGDASPANIRVSALACSSRCVVAGTYTDPFTVTVSGSPQTAPAPGGSSGGFLIGYATDLTVLWVRFVNATSDINDFDVSVTGTDAYLGFDFEGTVSIQACDTCAAEGPALASVPGGVAIVRHNITTGVAMAANSFDTTLGGRKPIGAADARVAMAMTPFGSSPSYFGTVIMDQDCGVAFFDPVNLGNPVVGTLTGPMLQACDAQASDGTTIFTTFSNGGMATISEPGGTVAATETGAIGVIGWDPATASVRWSDSFVATDVPGVFPELGSGPPDQGYAVAFDTGGNDAGTIAFSSALTLNIAACGGGPFCSSAMVRVGPLP